MESEEQKQQLIDIEIEKRTEFYELHKTKGDEMLVEITQGIKALNEKQLKDVLGIIGSYSNDLLINFCSKSHVELKMKQLPIEITYRIWRYLNEQC